MRSCGIKTSLVIYCYLFIRLVTQTSKDLKVHNFLFSTVPIPFSHEMTFIVQKNNNCRLHVFYKQPSYEASNVKSGLKFKQLAKQPPAL